jgi:putative cardiolipin synthase
MTDPELIDIALAIRELTTSFDRVEGALLIAGGTDSSISPSWLADQTRLSEPACDDLLLQLRRANAVERVPAEGAVYAVDPARVRACFSATREAAAVASQLEARQPDRTEVTPLVTLPADPSFDGITPEALGMDWLMPSLGRLLKQATDEISILTPFFEGDGFQQLHQPLFNTLADGTPVTVITRYLHDPDSHNRSVIDGFIEDCHDQGLPLDNLSMVDYTVWDDDISDVDRSQNGENPAFTLHAKLVLVDREQAYIGSANVTDYGFDQYLEVGALLEGPAVSSYVRLVEALLASEAATTYQI